jgi:hypothetical protein
MKRCHECDTFDFDKELVLSPNSDLPNSEYDYSLWIILHRNDIRLKRKKGINVG